MSLYRLVTTLVLSVCCWMLVLPAEDPTPKLPVSATAVKLGGKNSSSLAGNSTDSGGRQRGLGGFSVDSSMIQRALYVLIGITLTGLLYFLIRAVRLKKPVPKKKYGLLSNYDDSVEMEGVESEEDDTLYEARSLRR
ncbi:protein FAM174C [Eucyclogobius newberryi]|uniref:protein FAM174C n=1 Tax=Eucyclogobius newberryi TaxID=166745 RepID=UPI003B5B31F2